MAEKEHKHDGWIDVDSAAAARYLNFPDLRPGYHVCCALSINHLVENFFRAGY